jgi:uncharacterized protein
MRCAAVTWRSADSWLEKTMKLLLVTAALVLALTMLVPALVPAAEDSHATYDPELAARLGADDYGMRRYVMAFLKAGPDRSHDAETAARLQRGHLDNIRRLAEDGRLVLAGPFLDAGEIRGIFVFAVDTLEEARALVETDPAVQAGRLSMELHPWYGSAALMMMSELNARIAKANP